MASASGCPKVATGMGDGTAVGAAAGTVILGPGLGTAIGGAVANLFGGSGSPRYEGGPLISSVQQRLGLPQLGDMTAINQTHQDALTGGAGWKDVAIVLAPLVRPDLFGKPARALNAADYQALGPYASALPTSAVPNVAGSTPGSTPGATPTLTAGMSPLMIFLIVGLGAELLMKKGRERDVHDGEPGAVDAHGDADPVYVPEHHSENPPAAAVHARAAAHGGPGGAGESGGAGHGPVARAECHHEHGVERATVLGPRACADAGARHYAVPGRRADRGGVLLRQSPGGAGPRGPRTRVAHDAAEEPVSNPLALFGVSDADVQAFVVKYAQACAQVPARLLRVQQIATEGEGAGRAPILAQVQALQNQYASTSNG